MEIQITNVNNYLFVYCYGRFEGLTELESAKLFKKAVNDFMFGIKLKDIEENENGVYHFEIETTYKTNYNSIDNLKISITKILNHKLALITSWLKSGIINIKIL